MCLDNELELKADDETKSDFWAGRGPLVGDSVAWGGAWSASTSMGCMQGASMNAARTTNSRQGAPAIDGAAINQYAKRT